jgi:hypothetical protein
MNLSELGMANLNGSLNSHSKLNGANGVNGGQLSYMKGNLNDKYA